ncbi:hypothetical protein BHM03_00009549, partial [Ensete ventricosum]
ALAPLHPHCVIAAIAAAPAPTQAAIALSGRQPPCQGAATPAIGATAPAGGKAGRSRPPLRVGRSWPCPRVVAPCKGPGRSRSPLVGNQAMAGRP